MIKREDKRGLEMVISTVILIILGVVILIAVIFLFTRSSTSFGDKINSFLGFSNVDSIIGNCNNLVNQESKYEYCCVRKTVKLSLKESLDISCANATAKSWGKTIQQLNCEGVC